MAREDRFIGADIVVDKYHVPIDDDYSMSVRDYVLRPRALTEDMIITLPPVVEARGRFYSIIADDLGNVADVGLNWVTITHDNDSADWEADVVLKEKGRGHLFYSDGIKWVLETFGDMHFASNQVTGQVNLRGIHLTQEAAAAGALNIEVFQAFLTSDVKAGGWANAIHGKIDYQTSGAAHGMASVIVAEMIPPAGSLERGGLYCLECAVNPGAGSSWGSAGPFAFMIFVNWGTTGYFDDNAFFFRLENVYEEEGHMLSVNAHTLKVQIEGHVAGKVRYLVLSEEENGLSLAQADDTGGGLGVKSETTLTATGNVECKAVEGNIIYTPSTLLDGGGEPMGVAGRVTLTAGAGADLYMWGMRARLHFEATSVITCSQIAALRAVLTCDADPVVTSGHIACIYADNLCATALNGGSDYADLIRLANHGGAIDNAINVYGPNTSYFLRLHGCAVGSSFVAAGSAGQACSTLSKTIRIDIDGVDYYLLATTTPT